MYEIGSSSKLSSYRNDDSVVDKDIHVLLVHRDRDISEDTLEILRSCSIKVTRVVSAQQALSLMGTRRNEFNLLLMDAHLSDSIDPFTILGLAVAMKLPTILISSIEYDYDLARRALSNGALNLLLHPISKEMVMYCILHPVMRKEMKVGKNIIHNSENIGSTERPREIISFENNHGSEMLTNPEQCIKKSDQDFKWTDEMRQKFWDAVNHLDDGSYLPRKILKHMNVPGLTSLQVSSYLQKCRNESKRLLTASQPESAVGNSVMKKRKTSSYGAKPIMLNSSINIRARNGNINSIQSDSHQPSPGIQHLIADLNAGNNHAGHVDSEATVSIQQVPESSFAEKKAPPKFYNFLSLEEDNDPKENH